MGRTVIVTLLLLAAALVWLRPVPAATDVELGLPEVPGWQGPLAPVSAWAPHFGKADANARGAYARSDATIEAYANWHAYQTQRRELIGYGNRVEGDWAVVSSGARELELGRGDALSVREMIIASPAGERRVVWYFYRIGGQLEVWPVRAKLVGGWQVIMGRHGAGLVAASAACEDGCDGARERLAAWPVEAVPLLVIELEAAAGAALQN